MSDITQFHSCKYPLEWRGCYDKDSQYAKYVTPDSYSHPAKMSFGMLERIFKHLQELRLVDDNTTIVDFMAGTFRTGVMAELFGYRSIGIELEPHFIKMIEGNRTRIEKLTGRRTRMEFMQGDARSLSTMLREKGCVGVVSPPYSDALKEGRDTLSFKKQFSDGRRLEDLASSGQVHNYRYSTSQDNIGNLRDAPLVGITSPPYVEQNQRDIDKEGYGSQLTGGLKRNIPQTKTYSQNSENIGNLKDAPLVGITSPPYGISETSQQTSKNVIEDRIRRGIAGAVVTEDGKYMTGGGARQEIYSHNAENIGNLPDRQLVGITSPPFENQVPFQDKEFMIASAEQRSQNLKKGNSHYASPEAIKRSAEKISTEYSTDDNNIGNQTGQTYLSEMLRVYSEAFRSGISPLVLVTKNPTRNGKLRRLDLDTISILQQSGYEVFDYHRAILFEEVTQATLGGDAFTKPKGRLSFFKRLSYEKGNVVARWEDIIFARIPNGSGELTGITSPPYSEAQTGGGIAIEGYRGKHISEQGKNQPDKVGDRCGYMKARHGSNPANIGNLPDKEVQQ